MPDAPLSTQVEPIVRTDDNGLRWADYPDENFAERCNVVEDAKFPAPAPLHNLTWIHFPKYVWTNASLFFRHGEKCVSLPVYVRALALALLHPKLKGLACAFFWLALLLN